jgi:hypothetical protein
MHRFDERSNDPGPSLPRQSCPDCIIVTHGYDLREGQVATQKMERTVPLTLQWDETFDVGSDTSTPVDDNDHQMPFSSAARSTN